MIVEPARSIPVRDSVDVLVAGGGPAGIIAAEAAASDGLNVLLVESRNFLGGNLTVGLPILGFLGRKGNQIIRGLPQKFIDRLAEKNAASGHRACPLHVSLTIIDPEEVKRTALEVLTERGVKVLMYAFCCGVVMSDDKISGVIIESKAGREVIMAKTVIDCTGDADIAFRAGVPCEKGNDDGGMQPPTLMFCMKGVDVEKLRLSIADHPEMYDMDVIPNEFFREDNYFITVGLRNRIKKAEEEGLKLCTERTILITGLKKDEIWVNMSRIGGVDGTEPEDLTRGEMEGLKQIEHLQTYLRRYVPGFERASLHRVAPFLGIRESRRIRGKYVLTKEDILSCRYFEDAVAVASYPLDLHHPQDKGCTLIWCDDCYDIPYRSLLPAKVENLLVAGRAISTTHEALSAIRVMSSCMAMGEAAGRAAKQAVRKNIPPSQIDVSELRRELLSNGAFLRANTPTAL
ncbi:MAG: FAD-dependent oxidoreductase [Bacteroidales bacterium]|nr:FAD-dependent oxidoreductase [Bacteroidales bacterium]